MNLHPLNSENLAQTRMPRDRESGLTLPMVALFMVTLIIMMGLAIDVGVLYTARTSAQHAADAAALAGAFTFVTNPTPSASSATNAAQQAAMLNSILGTAVGLGDVTVTSIQLPTATQPGRVTVQVSRVVPTAFAAAFGPSHSAVAATATAHHACGLSGYITRRVCSMATPVQTR